MALPLYPGLTEACMRNQYAHTGGVARGVLDLPSRGSEAMVLGDIEAAIAGCSVKEVGAQRARHCGYP